MIVSILFSVLIEKGATEDTDCAGGVDFSATHWPIVVMPI
jgi:hypothetical protein